MAKAAIKSGKEKRDLGKAIMKAWQDAIDANAANPIIDRQALLAALDLIIDKANKGKTDRTIEYDIVFDTDLDASTRLVWLTIPTPDREKAGFDDTWQKYKNTFYDNLGPNDKKKREIEIAEAILFGCGR